MKILFYTLCSFFLILLGSLTLLSAATFQSLKDTNAATMGISGDGSVVVGDLHYGSQPFRWTAANGIEPLGVPPGSNNGIAYDASYDGSVVVGRVDSRAFRWARAGGFQLLEFSEATDVSGDGLVIVGNGGPTGQPVRWTVSDGAVELGVIPGFADCEAHGVSEDGSVVAGSCWDISTIPAVARPFRWTSSQGLVDLGVLPGYSRCYSMDISADGASIVGCCEAEAGPIIAQAFRWTQADGIIGLGVPPGSQRSQGSAVSGDGSVFIGVDEIQQLALIWDATNGIRYLKDVLINDYGLNLTGWILSEGMALSTDGKVMVGWGINPAGEYEDWVVDLRDDCVQTDFDRDFDIDGTDLVSYINNPRGIGLKALAGCFGNNKDL